MCKRIFFYYYNCCIRSILISINQWRGCFGVVKNPFQSLFIYERVKLTSWLVDCAQKYILIVRYWPRIKLNIVRKKNISLFKW